jgi:hypothetical protein
MASPTAGAVHRTGPAPIAQDYSKTIIQALTDDGLEIGPVSRVQLLLTCMFERLHDAIYVLPRQARDPGAAPVNPDEYARDVAMALKALKKYVHALPDDSEQVESKLGELNERIRALKAENLEVLQQAKSIHDEIYNFLVRS